MAKDQQGLTLAGSPQSAEAFDRAVADYFGLTGDPVGILKQALANDPDFALGAVAVAGLFMIGGFRGDHPEVTAALAAAEAGDPRRLVARKDAPRRGQGVVGGPIARRGARLGGHSDRLADRRARAPVRPGRLSVPRPVAVDPRLGRARAARLGRRQSAHELRSRRLCVRSRGGGRARSGRGRRPRGARPQSARRLGDACDRPRHGDRGPTGGGDRLPREDAAATGVPRASWPATTAGISPCS